jgi:hypothetical protein
MDQFNGFTHMKQYFINKESKKKENQESLDSERKILDEYKELLDETKKQMMKKIKQKGAELLSKITDTKKDVELETTKKIKCNGHDHKSLKTYKECAKKIYEEIDTSADFAYFFSTDDPSFNLMIESLFNMFPKTNDQIYLDKILKIKELVLEKEEMYNKLINSANTESDDNNLENDESGNDESEDDESEDNETEDDESENEELEANSNHTDSDATDSDATDSDATDSDATDSNHTDSDATDSDSDKNRTPAENIQILKDIIGSLHFSLKKATKFTVISKIKKKIIEKEKELQTLKNEYKISKHFNL